MQYPSMSPQARRGAIVPLTALVLTIVVAMVAFSVDLGWIVLVQADLQSTADSAALAGAGPLMDGYVLYNLPMQTGAQKNSVLLTYKDKARTAAKLYASYNSAGVSSLTLNDSDIQFGYTDASGNYTTPEPASTFPNTIKVTMRRDGAANGSVSLFFGPAVGKSTADLTASAAACIYAVNVSGFKNVSNFKAGMLPMTYDINHWNDFLSTGKDPDGNKSNDSDGNPDLQVYPSTKYTGNFGLLSLDASHVGTSTLNGWIDGGITQTEIQALTSASSSATTPLIPLSSHNSNLQPSAAADGRGSWNWQGDTGMKTDVLHTLDNHIGETYLLPLYSPLNSNANNYQAGNGNGSNYFYNIVQFVSVKVISSDNANQGGLVVEPSAMVLDFNMFTFSSNPAPAGTGSTSTYTTFVPPKLVQ